MIRPPPRSQRNDTLFPYTTLFRSGDGDDHSRYIEGVFSVAGGAIRVASIYLPNGNPADDPVQYPYKLRWMERLRAHALNCMALEEPLILAGDYNVIPEPYDCFNPAVWATDALFLPETRSAFRRLENLGLIDAVRATTDATKQIGRAH